MALSTVKLELLTSCRGIEVCFPFVVKFGLIKERLPGMSSLVSFVVYLQLGIRQLYLQLIMFMLSC